MKLLLKLIVFFALLGGAIYASIDPINRYLAERNRPEFLTETTETGEIKYVVNATGTVEPVISVQVGAFVSGPITDLFVDFNDEVEEDQLLAKIDPRIYQANVARDEAGLGTRKADLERVRARLQNAMNDEMRAVGLREDNEEFISQSELDQYKFASLALEAELALAEAGIKQAEANLSNSQANLDYTEIRSPVAGIIIDKKIEPGQTLTSQFQTPELFVIAPDMRKEMRIYAAVDEADIGLIRKAYETAQGVTFTVDAYPGELFKGSISQIRLSSTALQNVVTYPVVVSAPNADLKLLPGMTAQITFQIEKKSEVIKIPNAALRYYPAREHVREEDRNILDGTAKTQEKTDESESSQQPADVKAESHRKSRKRHIWLKEGDLLKAVEVTTGISDYRFTELISDEIKSGQEIVVGVKPK